MASFTSVSVTLVKPSTPTPPQHLFLAAADIVWRSCHYPHVFLAFKLPPSSSSSCVSTRLKSSLALALVDFFPCAGRIFEQPDGRLALDCNDAGVPFTEASIDIPFSSLETAGFQHQPFFAGFVPLLDALEWTPDLPLLSVQVTRFPRDEGLVIGMAFCHMLADGSSFWHFMRSWAECARGVPISMRPLHMREALGPDKLILPPATPRLQDGHASCRRPNPITRGGRFSNSKAPRLCELIQRDFHFPPEMVKKLKDLAGTISAPPGEHARFSSLQALSAHIWKHVAAARCAVSKLPAEHAFFLVANMRSRTVPPLPDAYFGNVLEGGITIAGMEDLLTESLGRTAMRIQDLIKTLDDTRMKTFQGKLETLDAAQIFEGSSDVGSLPWLQVSCSPHFPVYEVDFGWGRPLCVRTPVVRGDGEMMWYAGPEGGGSVDVALKLDKPAMDKLELDQGFLSLDTLSSASEYEQSVDPLRYPP